MRRIPGNTNGGFSLVELLIVMAIIVVILSIGIPYYDKYVRQAHELAVIQELNTIYSAEISYYTRYGKFAPTLTDLGPPANASAAEGPSSAALISGELASGFHNGYRFTLAASPSSFSVSAVPEQFGTSGSRSFYIDQSKIIHQNFTSEPATANSPQLH